MYAIAYYRISKGDKYSADAIQTQQQACERWAANKGVHLYKSYTDEGVSGSTSPSRRPNLLEAIRYLATGDILLVHRRDRLARDQYVLATIEYLVAKRGARIVSVSGEGTESDDPTSIMMRHLIDVFAEFERATIATRTRNALNAKRSRNERTGAIPYGKRLAPDGVHLEDNPQEQACIGTILQLHSEGLNRRRIRLAMDIEFPCRGKRWHDKTIKKIIENP